MCLNPHSNRKTREPQDKKTDYFLAKEIHFLSIDSTNQWAKENVEAWAPEGITIVSADKQTAGYGRRGTPWISPPEVNLSLSFCFFFSIDRRDLGHIPQLLMLSLRRVLGLEKIISKIKWPNDLLVNGKKVGGVLCECMEVEGQRAVICGLGLNVNSGLEDFKDLPPLATSLLLENKEKIDRKKLHSSLLKEFSEVLQIFSKEGFSPFFKEWTASSFFHRGDAVAFHWKKEKIHGFFHALGEDGSIEILLPTGEIQSFFSIDFVNESPLFS